MAGNSEILREYLVALGFRVEQNEAKKFDGQLVKWDKRAAALSKTLIGVGTAAVGMVATFTYQMERLYYASRRAESAAGNLQALDFGARQVGVKNITQSVEALARNLRANPGLQGLLNSLGVRVTGRDKSDVLMDLVAQLKKMPFFVAQRYANLFGIDPDTLYMLQDGLDKWKGANEQRKQWAREMGVDTEAAAQAGVELANQWNEVVERAGLFRDVLVLAMLPAIREFSKVMQEVLKDWSELIRTQPQQGSLIDRFLEGVGLKDVGGGVQLSQQAQERLGQNETDREYKDIRDPITGEVTRVKKNWLDKKMDQFMEWGGASKWRRKPADQASVDAVQDVPNARPGAPQTQAEIDAEVRRRIASGEGVNRGGYTPPSQNNAPTVPGAGMGSKAQRAFDYFVSTGWTREQAAGIVANLSKESNFNSSAVGDGGRAYGLAQWHPDRQAEFKKWAGKSIKDSSFEEQLGFVNYEMRNGNERAAGNALANARTAREAGAIVSDLYERPLRKEGAERGLAAEAFNRQLGNTTNINQTNNITVNGSNNPEATAKAVGSEVNRANADLVRNQKAKVY